MKCDKSEKVMTNRESRILSCQDVHMALLRPFNIHGKVLCHAMR